MAKLPLWFRGLSRPPLRLTALVLSSLILAACARGGGAGGISGSAFTGLVEGGSPLSGVSGSTVNLYAAGTAGYGVGATLLATTTSTSDGSFSFDSGSYTCPSGNPQVYVTATGGNAGGGSNPAIGMMALAGPCGSITSSTFVVVNELTTVAAQWGLAQFIDSTGTQIGSPSTNFAGLGNSVGLALANLVTSYRALGGSATNTGVVAAFWADSGATEANCSGSSPAANCDGLERLDTLANLLAACVGSSGPSSSACSLLFTKTGVPSSGTTLQAAHLMAANPSTNVSALFGLQSASSPFTPALSAAPDAWTLALNYTGGGLYGPAGVAVDALGNVWALNPIGGHQSVSEFGPSGVPISPATGYTGGGMSGPDDIAIDSAGNVWVTNINSSLTKLVGGSTPPATCPTAPVAGDTGCPLSPATGYAGGGLNAPAGIAADALGNVWVANFASGGGKSLSEFSSSGNPLSPAAGYTGGGLNAPVSIAIDATANVWVTNGNSLSEFNSSGTPLSPATGFTGGGLDLPLGIAIAISGNVWVANVNGNSLSEFDPSGAPLSPASGYTGGGLNGPGCVAIDASGSIWATNGTGNSLSEFNSSGAPLSPATGFIGGSLAAPLGVAIDGSGSVWVANSRGNSLSEFVGAAKPVTERPMVGCGQQFIFI